MKILHVNSRDNVTLGAGTTIAMYRLHLGLKKIGVDSKILCKTKTPELHDSTEIARTKSVKMVEFLLGEVTQRLGLNDIHCVSSFGIKGNKTYVDADILQFHCIHGGFFSYFAIPSLTARKPGILTLHDMWPITGHCAYSYDCDRWRVGCGRCPYPDVPPSIRRDNTRLEFKLKSWSYRRSDLAIVTPSSWLTKLAKQSMLGCFPIHEIPYGIDTETYMPLDREQCRSLLGIPPGKRVLMFAAARLTDWRKGGDMLMEALRSLPDTLKTEMVLLTLGDRGEAISESVAIPTLNLGYSSSDRLKAIAYSAADVFVSPTRAENSALVFLESMACGTPIVSFKVGGVPDSVRPGITGFLAEPENTKDLCDGIIHLLEDGPLRNYMSQQCRAIALKEYPLDLHVQRHVELYRQVLENGGA